MALTKIPGSLIDTASGINGLIYPSSDGTSGQFLKTDGSGNLSFATVTTYTDSDVETYLDGGTSTPTFATATVSGTLTVVGDLDLTGDINSYNVTDLDITDQTITLGAGQTEALSGGSGIIIDGSNASILWDETNTEFDINNSINVTGTVVADGLTVDGDTINFNTSAGDLDIQALGGSSNQIEGSGSIKIKAAGGSVDLINGTTEVLSTTATGINVTGDVDASGLLKVGINNSEYANNYIRFKSAGASYIDHNTVGQDINFRVSNASTLDTTALTIDSSGNVGIGTTPHSNSKLHILDASASLDDYTIHIEAYQPAVVWQDISGGPSTDFALQADSSALMFRYGDASTETQLASEAMRIDSSGNVGIGTTSPTADLSVGSTSTSSGDIHLRTTKTTATFTPSNSDAGGLDIGVGWVSGGQGPLTFTLNSSERMRIESDGKIQIGNNIPMWSGQYGGALILKGNNSTSDRHARLTVVDSTGVAAYTGLIVNNTGNVGIGTSNPGNTLEVYGESQYSGIKINGSSHKLLDITTSSGNHQSLVQFTTGSRSYVLGIETDNTFMFRDSTSAANRMVLLPGRSEVLINRSSGVGAASSASLIVGSASDQTIRVLGTNSSGYSFMGFYNGGLNGIGSISNNSNTNTSFNTSSDYRFKQNVNDNWDATSILKQLRPVEFTWIADETDEVHQGFLAHEVQEHLPFAVTGEKDAVQDPMDDGEGGTIPGSEIKGQEMDYAKVVPLLVKTIQELEARITELENA